MLSKLQGEYQPTTSAAGYSWENRQQTLAGLSGSTGRFRIDVAAHRAYGFGEHRLNAAPIHFEEAFDVRPLATCFFHHRLIAAVIATTLGAAAIATTAPVALTQQAPQHLNPAIEKLAHGQPVIGIQTDDMSLQNCHSLARIDFDYAYVDMEHGPLNLDGLAYCVAAMVDKQAALKKGNAQPKVALFARFPPYGRDLQANDWIVKQALDMGLMGIIFNGVDNKEQMTQLVRYMRYPQQKNSEYQQPPGLRGYSPGNAVFAWGITASEYERHADLWPLNPEGDLLAIAMIETAEGLKNVDEIASVPGVGAIFIGAGGDLHQYLGVAQDSPEVETARQTILAACKSRNVACGITATTKAEVDRRLKEGWKMIRTGRGE